MDYIKPILAKLENEAIKYEYDSATGHIWKPAKYRDFKGNEPRIYRLGIRGYNVAICVVCNSIGVIASNYTRNAITESNYKWILTLDEFRNIKVKCSEAKLQRLLL